MKIPDWVSKTARAITVGLISLAVIMAIPRFGGDSVAWECSTIRDLYAQLHSAAEIWEKEAGHPPKYFTDFVTSEPFKKSIKHSPGAPTISLNGFGSSKGKLKQPCQVEKNLVICYEAFDQYLPVYTFHEGKIELLQPVYRKDKKASQCAYY